MVIQPEHEQKVLNGADGKLTLGNGHLSTYGDPGIPDHKNRVVSHRHSGCREPHRPAAGATWSLNVVARGQGYVTGSQTAELRVSESNRRHNAPTAYLAIAVEVYAGAPPVASSSTNADTSNLWTLI